ncbi:HAD family hydrolase [Candidatus Chloroploca sp. Khr17]|uniref:HAD family hydrolase n=1 Tax=Candidatus Chloroploca sp. Khr17 TaxID=2496869 RepID=UPI00101C8C7B|nr:HAD hydrolase-like protein [Candidatus Chloroploca sp. Khr17]
MDRLVLWDVDGTLLSTDGLAAEAMRATMREVVGPTAPMARTAYAGKTDWQIIRESFPTLAPEAIAAQLHAFTVSYARRLEAQRDELARRSQLFPGVQAALEALAGRVRQAPLTGNIAAVARIKLAAVGLVAHLDLAAGAYGDDHHHRPELVPIAAARAAARYGRPFAGHEIVIVGDTPHDIACGKANGTRTVGVATGPYPFDELVRCNPDVVLTDLRDTEAVIRAVFG